MTSLRADGQARRRRSAVPAAHGHAFVADLDRDGFVADMEQPGKLARSNFKSRDQKPVLDIVAKSIEPDLAGGKANFPGAHEPRGVVDDPHDSQGRGMLAAALPNAQRLERLHRTLK